MKNFTLLAGLITLTIFGCGPTEQEIKQREQFVADSLQREQNIADSLEAARETNRIHLEKIEVGKQMKKNWLNSKLETIKNEYTAAGKKYQSIDEFQFGRALSTKEKQLNSQRQIIIELEEIATAIETEIAQTKLFESYDFQSSPSGTINHLFEAAKTRKFDKLQFLIDPYGEANNSAYEICFYQILDSETKERWINALENGRLIGEPIIKEEKAIVEFAVGINSDRLEKVTLINRNGRWFLIEA